jgi:hypothetical protein
MDDDTLRPRRNGGDMDPVRYETIEPNIARIDVDGAQVRVVWKCPASGREVGQSSAWMAADPSIAARVQASLKRSVAQELIYGAARWVAGMLGGAAGRVVGNAVYTAAGELNTRATADVDYTPASREAAIVAAFASVQADFVWDGERSRFVARPPAA